MDGWRNVSNSYLLFKFPSFELIMPNLKKKSYWETSHHQREEDIKGGSMSGTIIHMSGTIIHPKLTNDLAKL